MCCCGGGEFSSTHYVQLFFFLNDTTSAFNLQKVFVGRMDCRTTGVLRFVAADTQCCCPVDRDFRGGKGWIRVHRQWPAAVVRLRLKHVQTVVDGLPTRRFPGGVDTAPTAPRVITFSPGRGAGWLDPVPDASLSSIHLSRTRRTPVR